MANLNTVMGDLDSYKDKVIVFEAVKTSDSSRLITRQPLRPSNTQLPSSPHNSSQKSTAVKASLDGPADENHNPLSAMPNNSLPPTRDIHGQALRPGTQHNGHRIPPSSDRRSQTPRSPSHSSSSGFRSSTLPHSSVKSRLTPYLRATTPSMTYDQAVGKVDKADFERYCASWGDRVRVSNPGYNDGTQVIIFSIVPIADL